MNTLIEIAQARLDQVQAEIQRLEHEQHTLEAQRGAAQAAGNVVEHDRLGQLFRENNVALRTTTGGHLLDARQALAQAQQDLRIAHRRALEAVRGAHRFDAEIDELTARLASLQTRRAAAQEAAEQAQDEVAALEPPAPPAPAPATPVEPEPKPAPEFLLPTRTLSLRGEPTQYFRGNIETDAQGKPLAVQPEPQALRKLDPNAAQVGESLY